MKKTIIRLTESDLHQMIMEAAHKLLKEYDRDEWDEYPEYDEPSFALATLYANLDNGEIQENDEFESDGCWVCVSLKVTDYDIENNGIGSYEFWGTPGYDEGTDYYVPTDCEIVRIDGAWIVQGEDVQKVNVEEIGEIDDNLAISIEEYALENNLFG